MSDLKGLQVADAHLAALWDAFFERFDEDERQPYKERVVQARLGDEPSVVFGFDDIQHREPLELDANRMPHARLSDLLLEQPARTLRLGAAVMHQLDGGPDPKPRLHLRIHGLPRSAQMRPRDLKSRHRGQLVAVRGVVSVQRDPYTFPMEIAYECRFCGNLIHVLQEEEHILEPVQCDGCEKSGPWRICDEQSRFIDAQKLTLQDSPETLGGNHQPRDRLVVAMDDLADIELAGQRVVVTAIPQLRWRYKGASRKKEADIVLEAIHIATDADQDDELEPTQEQRDLYEQVSKRKDVHAFLSRSLAPHDIGNHWWSLALLLQLAGCSGWVQGNDRARGMIHVVIASEPGMNKTMLLRAAHRCAPLCIRTDGHDTSGGGLTASAVQDKEDGQWRIEAGAAARANNGILAIDEFNHLHVEHQPRLFNLMEEGTINVAKAGKTATLLANTSVLGTMNPKGRHFDRSRRLRLVEQLDLDEGIASRIDLLFCEMDEVNLERDQQVALSILGRPVHDDQGELLAPSDLRRYIHICRQVEPAWSDELNVDVCIAYAQHRTPGEDGMPGTDPRLNATLRRLATASARIRWSETVEPEDLQLAIDVLRAALSSQGEARPRLQRGLASPWMQEERVRVVRSIVEELQGANGHADEDQVVERCLAHGLTRSAVVKELERACRQGGMYRKQGEGTYATM